MLDVVGSRSPCLSPSRDDTRNATEERPSRPPSAFEFSHLDLPSPHSVSVFSPTSPMISFLLPYTRIQKQKMRSTCFTAHTLLRCGYVLRWFAHCHQRRSCVLYVRRHCSSPCLSALCMCTLRASPPSSPSLFPFHLFPSNREPISTSSSLHPRFLCPVSSP